MSGTSRREASALAEVFERLFKSYRSEIFRAALRSSRNRQDAEDLTQTTFLNAYAALQRGAEPEAPRAGLHAIARNAGRRRLRQARIVEVELEPEASRAPDEDLTAVHELQSALARLTFNQRASLMMREVGGLSAREIGARLGISPGAVATLLFRARRALRAELDAGDKPTTSRLRLGVLYATLVRPLWTRLGAPIFDGGEALTRSAAAVGVVAAAAGVTVFTGATGSPSARAGHARAAVAARPDVVVPKATLLPVVRTVEPARVPSLPRIRLVVHAAAAHPVARGAAHVTAAPAPRRGSQPPPHPTAGAPAAASSPTEPAPVPAAVPVEPVAPAPQPSASTPNEAEPSAAPARPAAAPERVDAVTKPVRAATGPVTAVTAPAVADVSQVTSAVPVDAVPGPSTTPAPTDAVPAPAVPAPAVPAPAVPAPVAPPPLPAAQLPTG